MKLRKRTLWFKLALFLALIGAPFASAADEELKPNGNDRELLPGEEVVTPTGQKMKVWSTKGEVAKSPAPTLPQVAPDPLPEGVGVIVDQRQNRPKTGGMQKESKTSEDNNKIRR